jgi:hypothetical protein
MKLYQEANSMRTRAKDNRYYFITIFSVCIFLSAFVSPIPVYANGEIWAWGTNGWGQCNVPEPNTSFKAIAAGFTHSLGLKGCPYNLDGDIYEDCKVDFHDLTIMGNSWRTDYDMYDLDALATDWLIDCLQDSSNPACVH